MSDTEPDLTPLQLSMAATGRRYWRAVPAVYDAMRTPIDAARGFPVGSGTRASTIHSLPARDGDSPPLVANDSSGHVIISLEVRRVTPADAELLATAPAGTIKELTAEEFEALKPITPEEVI